MSHALRFRGDGGFRLLQLTDMHITGDAAVDGRTLALARELIAATKPDLIVNTGDAVYGPDNLAQMDAALAPLVESAVPWTFTFGNHDGEYSGNKPALYERLRRMPGCLIDHDPASGDGVGNHAIELRGGAGELRWLVVCLDSGETLDDPLVGGYQYLTRRQIDWYRDTVARYAAREGDFRAMVFMHMALPEFEELWQYETTYGTRREGIGAPRINSGFFAAMLEAGHAGGVFVGHDHVNDFWGRLYGVAMGYGRMSGYGSYGADDMPRGGRVFEFDEKKPFDFETWVVLEGGAAVKDPWVRHPLKLRENG